MTTNTAHTRTYIEQKRAEYEAATSPAGASRLHLLSTHDEALPGEELGRMAQQFDAMGDHMDMHDELSQAQAILLYASRALAAMLAVMLIVFLAINGADIWRHLFN